MEIIYKPSDSRSNEDTALPYPALPYPALPYPALPYPALPYPALPYPSETELGQDMAELPNAPSNVVRAASVASPVESKLRSPDAVFDGYGGIKNDFLMNRRRVDSENRRNYKEIYSAGILPFSVKGGTLYFLLGKDPENKWSDFGGRSEVQDKGRWDVTATREFYEESVGVVMDISSMLTRLQHRKNYIKVKGKTLSGSPYYMYVVKIPFKETYKETFDNTLGFIRYSNVFDKKYLEKIDLQWVSLETINAGLDDENNNLVNFPLRKVFKKTLVDNLQTITLFTKQFIDITENAWIKK
jgi:hypothetical protein